MNDLIVRFEELSRLLGGDMLLDQVLNKSNVKRFIIDLNHGQLQSGIDSQGESLGEYAPSTIEYKKRKGQIHTHITLKDSGDFYDSFQVVVTSTDIIIITKPVKSDGTNLIEEYGEDIVGLTPENLEKLCELIALELESAIVSLF